MNLIILSAIVILPTAILLLTFVPNLFKRSFSTIYNLSIAGVIMAFIAGLVGSVHYVGHGQTDLVFFEWNQLGLVICIDALSLIVYSMIAIIALVVIRFSKNYLDGEPNQDQFLIKLTLTVAFVQLLVLSGNLATLFVAWVGTSIGLHALLLFYPNRKKAVLAARKKFFIARLGDLSLLGAFTLIYFHFQTGDLSVILDKAPLLVRGDLTIELETAGVLLMISACLKSVQLPFHGWLLEVMETPTPVSALLHAGLLNAGPFLIIRFSPLFDLSTGASIALVLIGALSALFGAIASSAQSTIKTSLAYSSVGHMGFTLLLCGLGVYSAALLHLVAHSFYKAHAFLSSGSVIDKVQTQGAFKYRRTSSISRILLALFAASLIYISLAIIWKIDLRSDFQMLIISAIIFLGVLSLTINTIDSTNKWRTILYLTGGAILIINCFFLFEDMMSAALISEIPEIRSADNVLIAISLMIVAAFTTTVVVLSVFPRVQETATVIKWRTHFRNGLYINQFLNALFRTRKLEASK